MPSIQPPAKTPGPFNLHLSSHTTRVLAKMIIFPRRHFYEMINFILGRSKFSAVILELLGSDPSYVNKSPHLILIAGRSCD